jgi:hydroxymethylbilane synthase
VSALRLASRGSRLALVQAGMAEAALRAGGAGEIRTLVVRTQGDRAGSTPVERLRGVGWFTAALERAVAEGRADVAVHSAKDLPSRLAPGLRLAGHLERGDCRDGLITRGGGIDSLPERARVGTSSPRRAALLPSLRADLVAVPVRGNVDTRLAKLDRGEVDALVMACAGMDRLQLGDRVAVRLDPRAFVPAPCQGVIALEAAPGNPASRLCAAADDPGARAAAAAERAVLEALGGGCLLPLGAWARAEDGRLVLTAVLALGGALRRAEVAGDPAAPEELGHRTAAELR